MAAGRLEVGAVGRAHGLRGDVTVRLVSDRVERVAPGAELYLADGRRLRVRSSRPHQSGHIVDFEGVDGREAAEALRGSALFGDPIDDPDALWVHELIGSVLVDRVGTPRGTVVEVEANPASDLLVTDRGDLVPLTFVTEVADGTIVVDAPLGLFADDPIPADVPGSDHDGEAGDDEELTARAEAGEPEADEAGES